MTDNKAKESQLNNLTDTTDTTVRMGTNEVKELNIFYRDASKPVNRSWALNL